MGLLLGLFRGILGVFLDYGSYALGLDFNA